MEQNEIKEKIVDDEYIGNRVVNDAWIILHNYIIAPIRRRGFIDLEQQIGYNKNYDEVLNDFQEGSAIRVFLLQERTRNTSKSESKKLSVIIHKVNQFLQSLVTELSDHEKHAICFYVFRLFGNNENDLIRNLFDHFKCEIEFEIIKDNDVHIIYDPNMVRIELIANIKDYTDVLEKYIGNNKKRIFFRGHGSIAYELLPSLFRNKGFFLNERNMYLDLMTRCPDDFSCIHNHIDILAQMQHYGLPTRLLDVTSNALTALFFACESTSSRCGEVVLLEIESRLIKHFQDIETVVLSSLPLLEYEDLKRLFEQTVAEKQSIKMKNIEKPLNKLKAETFSEKTYSDESFNETIRKLDGYYLVSPQKLNRRMMNQDGAFLLCGLFDRVYAPNPFERNQLRTKYELEELRVKNEEGKKVIIIVKNKDKIMESLNTYGINKTRIYPEIDKVSEYLKEQYQSR